MNENNSPSFESLGIDDEILSAIQDLGYTSPTPIQAMAIQELTKGYDLIGQSKTGTGKTAAFAIPLIELIDPDDRRLQALVLCPTRELCMQNAEEIRKLLKYKQGIRVVAVYGGQPINHQIQSLKGGVQILTATPGRLIDHLRRHTLKLDQVLMAVLDEADEMISMGFKDDIDLILSQLPEERQTVLLSATMPEDVVKITEEFMEDPKLIQLSSDTALTVESTRQLYCEVKPKDKTEALLRLLTIEQPDRALVFCNTKKLSDELAEALKKRNLPAEGLHGDLKQVQRDLTLRRFKNGDVKILVATDVAARGLDIQGIDVVFNYDLPLEEEFYVHRIGRTGRAGKEGKAYTFITEKELPRLKEISAYTGHDVSPFKIPSLQDVNKALKDKRLSLVKQILTGSSPTLPRYQKYAEDIESLVSEGFSEKDIAAALLASLLYIPEAGSDPITKMPKRLVQHPEKTIRLFVSVGRRQKVKVKDLIQAVTTTCGIPAGNIGQIEILETFSYIEVPLELSGDIVGAMDGTTIKGVMLHIEVANQK